MKTWLEDLLSISENPEYAQAVFKKIQAATRELGFEHCAYGIRIPLPFSNPQ